MTPLQHMAIDAIMKTHYNVLLARGLRLAVIQEQFDQGIWTESEAKELLSGPLTPGDESTIYDDSDQLKIKVVLKVCQAGHMICEFGAASLSGHDWHCPGCDHHLTSLYLCPECGVRYEAGE